jgi:hypothetical protein
MLRGVNLAGSSKVPVRPNGATYNRTGFFDHRAVSFVGRPFSLAGADEHFARLRAWGFTFLRFLVTWEAVEHGGPGVYDEAYLDYLREVVKKAGEHGISLFVDPHQDVWSRFSGGDGAPGWTLEAVGFDMTHFQETGAAIVHQVLGDPLPRMIWLANYTKLATATMFTLFFAGNDFAPQLRIEGVPVQEYLQGHYVAAMQRVAERLCDLQNVVGYDTLNEPLHGFIGCADLAAVPASFKLGDTPTPFQAMALGGGCPQQVDVWDIRLLGISRVGTRLVNPHGLSAWLPGRDCVWRQHGVWDMDGAGQPRLLEPGYFSRVDGRPVDFNQDYYKPFATRFAHAMRSVHPDALIFLETEAGFSPPAWGPDDPQGIVYAPHWYDGVVLIRKSYTPWIAFDVHRERLVFGPGRIRRSFAGQMAVFKRQAAEQLGGAPVLIGESGIPFDMGGKRGYASGDLRPQAEAADRSWRAIEDNLLHCTWWNYTPDNSNERGDLWNDEDLSIFSRDQQRDPGDIYSGGRALGAVVRPYPMAIAGQPLHLSFDSERKVFEFSFRHDPEIAAPTEIFVPDYQYPMGCTVEVSDGRYDMRRAEQTLIYWHSGAHEQHHIRITR